MLSRYSYTGPTKNEYKKKTKKNPATPAVINAACQPQVSAIHGKMIGAMIGPTFAPELNKLVAKARSFLGNHSATVLIEVGKLPASVIPTQARATKEPPILPTSACHRAARLQPVIEME